MEPNQTSFVSDGHNIISIIELRRVARGEDGLKFTIHLVYNPAIIEVLNYDTVRERDDMFNLIVYKLGIDPAK